MLKQMDPIIDYKNISPEELNLSTLAEPVLVEDPAITQLRTDILAHIESLRLPETNAEAPDKEIIRFSHAHQRQEVAQHQWQAIGRHVNYPIDHFANGDEVNPERINLSLFLFLVTIAPAICFAWRPYFGLSQYLMVMAAVCGFSFEISIMAN